MIIRIEKLQDACKKILAAVDNNELSEITETLELVTKGNFLCMNVTNREYYAQVKLDIEENIEFKATVNANLFLRLISQVTTDTIELLVDNNKLIVKGNGTYNIPLIFDGDKLLNLPEIEINNVTNSFNISSSILGSILHYNSKELVKGTISKPVQRLYYVDEKGCITFTTGACVNKFTLEQPVKLLFNNRLVKLFRLFDTGDVKFTLGYDPISEGIIQTKVRFESKDVLITAIISCDDTFLSSVPVNAIRGRAEANYPYSININKNHVLQTINRILLFTNNGNTKGLIKPYSTFEFGKDSVTIYDAKKDNKEVVSYNNSVLEMETPYSAILDLVELKITLDNFEEPYLTINFGDGNAMVITRGNITNVVPECSLA